jgi:hypothetical protein
VQFVERRDAETFYNDMKGRDVDGRAVKVDWDINQADGAYDHGKVVEEFKKVEMEPRRSRSPMRDVGGSPQRRSRSPLRRSRSPAGSPRRHGVDARGRDSRSPPRR